MKKSILKTSKLLTSLIILLSVITACEDTCKSSRTFYSYEPVFTPLEDIRSSVQLTDPTTVESVGKMYFKDNYLFINEPAKGIHIIDNHDPSNPINVGFITVPGAFDLAVKGDMLYSDSYIDLVVIDISDLDNIHEVARRENVFSNYNSYGVYTDPERGVVTGWELSDAQTVNRSDCDGQYYETWGYADDGMVYAFENSGDYFSAPPSTNGIGGSMARFALAGNYLYTLDNSWIKSMDVSNPAAPSSATETEVNWDIETIFPKGDKLFIGSSSGMYIMDLAQDPASPQLLSNYEHIRSCDPVVVDDKYAYVTLRSGSRCQGFTNQLEVIDIADLSNPKLLKTYELTNPHGLGKDGNVLFICDGNDGLKIFNAEDPLTIGSNMIEHYKDIQAFDIIPFNNVAMMIGEDGLYQYDYSNMDDIKFLSKIQIKASN
ncbi:LVIVD repeat-containing protein [Fulvivirga ligni]|uniref:LVIVD repeat-containing protein n=1 Tax=Fulvivirga ligni TaxID=2904246 RepID=UPI001F4726E6|nr:hypothetical protein [Fulvivirga ligni]UII20586.1 hypothetical protein LVD16_22350 [Fulvivirga ligni]